MADEGKRQSPAYVAYPTFKNTIRGFAAGGHPVPSTIDSSVLTNMSGSSQNQFLVAMRFFGLIDEANKPSNTLLKMAAADENGWNAEMKALVLKHYPAQVGHLTTGTPKTLRESFGEIGGIVKPAVRFLLAACKDTGIPVSPHILKDKSSLGTPKRRKLKQEETSATANGSAAATPPSSPPPADDPQSFKMALLAKFPSFDPNWGEQQQKAWFDAYAKLLEKN